MGGTDADRSGFTAKPKPPLPPKPPLLTKPNGAIESSAINFDGVLSTNKPYDEIVEDSVIEAKQKEIKECRMHDVEINPAPDSMEPRISKNGVTVPNMERSASQIEPSSVNTSLQSSHMSTSSDKTNTRRTATRGRPRRISRHFLENGESGDEACCIKFAGMLRTKAVDMASKSKMLPPAKPPKPDNLVKSKGRHRKGSQQNGMPCHHSIGDDFSIDGSHHGVRFVDDDETESSTDYKDFDENSVFLLELACHCDAQNISRGTGMLTEGVESGYYTSDIVKTDEEANLSDSYQLFDKKCDVKEVGEEIVVSSVEESLPHLIKENAMVTGSNEIDNTLSVKDEESNKMLITGKEQPVPNDALPDNEKCIILNSSNSFIPSKSSVEREEKDPICDSHIETIINRDEDGPVILIQDSSSVKTKEAIPLLMKDSVQKPKRVKSPPRPPPPSQLMKKHPESIIITGEKKTCLITKELISNEEIKKEKETLTGEIKKEEETVTDEIKKETSVTDDIKTEEIVMDETKKEEETASTPAVNESMKSEKSIPIPEVPQVKKRVTSPPRPPAPKIKEISLDKKEIVPLSVDEMKNLEQNDDFLCKKQGPPVPSKPVRKRNEIIPEKSSLEPLDLSTKDDIDKSVKPLSLSPKTFPRSGKQTARFGKPSTASSQVKKMEFPSPLKPNKQMASKPVMTTVVRNTYLEGLQPLPLLKSPNDKKQSPTRPPPPMLTKIEKNISPPSIDSAIEQNDSVLAETSDNISEAIDSVMSMDKTVAKDETTEDNKKLTDIKDQDLNESLISACNITSDIHDTQVSLDAVPMQDTITDDKSKSMVAPETFIRNEIQSSTWPTAVERKKRKQMKSPPRPPPPSKDALMIGADSSKEAFPRQTYETSSLDSRGRKRIKSPPRPPPPQFDKLPLKIEEEPFLTSTILPEEQTKRSDVIDKNGTKRIKSPPRPPPPVYEKLPLKRIVNRSLNDQLIKTEKLSSDNSSEMHIKSLLISQNEKTTSKTTEDHMTCVPLATEEIITDDVDLSSLENKKRVTSPPRPPPPVYEKLSLRRTDKPNVSLTTPRIKKPNGNIDSQRHLMSLQRPSAISKLCDSNQQFSSIANVLHEYEEIQPPDEECLASPNIQPKAPPRVKRNRSRTVEVVTVTEKPVERKRRSHSLTETDVLKKLEDRGLLSTPQRSEMKTLYTTVQKQHGKMRLKEIDASEEDRKTPGYDKMKLRPLPPPPPPPRCRSRSSMSQSPASVSLNTSVSEAKLDSTQENSCSKTEQMTKQADLPEYDENANISTPSKMEVQKKQEVNYNSDLVEESQGEKQIQNHKFQQDQSLESVVVHRKSRTPPSVRSKSPSPSKHISCSSWYDESDVSGDLGDVDTSSSIKGSAEAINKDDSESVMSKQKQAKTKSDTSRTSTFYCDLEDDAFHDCATELPSSETERPISASSLVEKSVQTSPERELGLSSREKDNHSDDTDDLLDRARAVQTELCLILERRKRKKGQNYGCEEDTKSSCSYTPSPKSTIPRSKIKTISDPPVADDCLANSESPLIASPVEGRCHLSSTRSSNSELCWQVSSDESDDDNNDASSIFLQKKKKKAFQIANEIMTSEETFVSALKLLNEDFRGAVDKANKERGGTVISEEVINALLKYFPQLQHLNENLFSELKERIKHWEETEKIADIIVKIGPFLKLYSSYIRDFDAMEAALDDARRRYPLFDQVTKEFESSDQCKKLALKHYMLKPIQRIPLYRLLLQEYLHNLTPDSPDYKDTLTALQIVGEVADHANETLKQGDNFQKLISIQNSVFGQHEVIRPGRVFLKEGELMKLSRKDMQPRWFILFNDSLLYLTSIQQGLFKVNNELPLAGMKVHIPQQEDYQHEFSIISVTRSFTLSARSLEERQEWIDALNKAIEENASRRNTFATVMMQQKVGKEEQANGSFVLGKQAPVWIPDARVTMCQLCTSGFTVTFRRHHCRACGKVVCSLCSANQAPLQYRNFNVARVCDECFEKLQKEFEATDPIEKGVEESGSCSEVAETDSDSPYAMAIKAQFKGNVKNAGKKNKRQLPSVLKEVCANDQGSTISGYLHRRHRKYWKRFWFVLKDKVLYTYKASEDVAALESVPLLGFKVEAFTKPFEGIDAELLFQLTHPGQVPIVFHADAVTSAERWIQAMQHATILE